MGALHEGHGSLVRRARQESDVVVASIFVNPLQFAPGEDFERYPRDLEGDRAKLESWGCDLLFTTSPSALYHQGFQTYVVLEGRSSIDSKGPRARGIFVVSRPSSPSSSIWSARPAPTSGARMRSRPRSSGGWSRTSTFRPRSSFVPRRATPTASPSPRGMFTFRPTSAPPPRGFIARSSPPARASARGAIGAPLRAALEADLRAIPGAQLGYAELVDPSTFERLEVDLPIGSASSRPRFAVVAVQSGHDSPPRQSAPRRGRAVIVDDESPRRLVVRSSAKLNLFLEVGAKRADGYHEIETLFHEVGIFDRIELEAVDSPRTPLEFTCDSAGVAAPGANLVEPRRCRVPRRNHHSMGCEDSSPQKRPRRRRPRRRLGQRGRNPPSHSKDCWGPGLRGIALHELASGLGSDCAFFLRGGSAIGTGRGEILRQTQLPRFAFLVVVPPVRCSTAEIYASLGAIAFQRILEGDYPDAQNRGRREFEWHRSDAARPGGLQSPGKRRVRFVSPTIEGLGRFVPSL